MKVALSFTLVLLLLLGCSKGKEEKQVKVENKDDFRTYELSINSNGKDFADLVSSVELLRLEETADSYLTYTNGIMLYEGGFILPETREGNIYFFDTQGNFQHKFNKMGEGPQEYESIHSIWLKNNTIQIWDINQDRIKTFDFEGNFVNSQKSDYSGMHAWSFGDGYVMDMSMRLIDDSLRYNVVVLDKDLKKKELWSPYTIDVPFPISSSINAFKPYKDGVLFKHSYRDTVYFFSQSKSITPLMSFDFGDELLWSDPEMYKNGEMSMQNIGSSGKVWIYNTWVGSEFVYLGYNTSFSDYGAKLINRATGEVSEIDYSVKDEDVFPTPILWKDGRLLMNLDSDEVEALFSALDESQIKYHEGTTLDEVISSENPALIWVNFK